MGSGGARAAVDHAWDEHTARAAIRAIAADTEDAFDEGWSAHPRDIEPGEPERWSGTYRAARAWSTRSRLAERGFVELRRDYFVPASASLPTHRAEPDARRDRNPARSIPPSPSGSTRERLASPSLPTSTPRSASFWGSPGTLLAARELGFEDLVRASSERLLAARDPETGLWEQHLYGEVQPYVGAGHGFAGCVLALGEVDGAGEVARRHAIVEGGLANWPPYADGQLARNDTIRVQWCHGAPGMITSLGDRLDEDLALAGGELVWRAGPLAKGGGLCHGTAGNGYAFLSLLERTDDELWLERARRFAMHALGQVEGRHSLWTGDPGIALYLADCIDGGGRCRCPSGGAARGSPARRARARPDAAGRAPASTSPGRPG